MNLLNEKINSEKLYSVGYDVENSRYVLNLIIPSHAWYSRYYLISKDEYDWFETSIESLNDIVDSFRYDNEFGDRFIKSDLSIENKNAKNYTD